MLLAREEGKLTRCCLQGRRGSQLGVACKGGGEVNKVLLAREEEKLTRCCLQGRRRS